MQLIKYIRVAHWQNLALGKTVVLIVAGLHQGLHDTIRLIRFSFWCMYSSGIDMCYSTVVKVYGSETRSKFKRPHYLCRVTFMHV